MLNSQPRLTVKSFGVTVRYARYFYALLSSIDGSFALNWPIRCSLSLALPIQCRGCISYRKLERKINMASNTHACVRSFVRCLFKCQYQYLDRMNRYGLMFFYCALFMFYFDDGKKSKCIHIHSYLWKDAHNTTQRSRGREGGQNKPNRGMKLFVF